MKSIHDILEKSALPIFVIILIPIAFIAYALWGTGAGSSPTQTNVPATQATTTPSATISLNNPFALPQSVAAGQFIPFSFTITNTGTTAGNIPFKVYVKWSTGEEDVIDENVSSLQGGASATISENLKFEVANETAQIYLELTQSGKTVQFELPRTN